MQAHKCWYTDWENFTSIKDKAINANSRVILDTDSLDPVLYIGQTRETCHQPAVAEAALLDVGTAELLHKSWLLKDLVHPLYCLGYHSARVEHGGHAQVIFAATEAV